MAHTFDVSVYATGNSNPQTLSITCSAGATLLVLGIGVVGTTARTNYVTSPPTFGGRAFSLIAGANPASEINNELWYYLNPSTGAAYTISVPNAATSKTLFLYASSYDASPGYTSRYDSSSYRVSSAANPSSNINFSAAGNVAVQIHSTGVNTQVGLPYPGLALARQADMGNYQAVMQYYISPSGADVSMGFPGTAIATGAVAGVWGEQAPPRNAYGGILKYYDGAAWTECPSGNFRIYLNGAWTICPSQNFKIYRSDFIPPDWYPIRFRG